MDGDYDDENDGGEDKRPKVIQKSGYNVFIDLHRCRFYISADTKHLREYRYSRKCSNAQI